MTYSNVSTLPPLPPYDEALETQVDLAIDARGLRCPLPLLRAKQSLRDLPVGALLRLSCTDSGSVRDFQAYARISGHQLVGFSAQDDEFVYWLRKQ